MIYKTEEREVNQYVCKPVDDLFTVSKIKVEQRSNKCCPNVIFLTLNRFFACCEQHFNTFVTVELLIFQMLHYTVNDLQVI